MMWLSIRLWYTQPEIYMEKNYAYSIFSLQGTSIYVKTL